MATSPNADLNDSQLLEAKLRIDDPMAIDGLSTERPSADLPPAIVGEYHLDTSGPAMRCCHCPQHTQHWHGFVITNSTGAKFLIGSACGPKHYRLSFAYARRMHGARVKRQGLLIRLFRIRDLADGARSILRAIAHSDGLRIIEAKRKEIERLSADFVARLQNPIQHGDPLMETVKVRDLEAEQRRPDDGDTRPLFRDEKRSVGLVIGGEVVQTREDPRDNLIALKAALDAAVSAARDTGALSTSALSKIVLAVESRWSSMEATIQRVEAAHLFFAPDNVARLARWSGQFEHFVVSPATEGLAIAGKGRALEVVAPIAAIELPKLPRLS